MSNTELNEIQQKEIKSIGRLLARMAELAEQAGLTGCFENGAAQSVAQYNVAVARLEVLGAIPANFFVTLPEDSGFGEVGVVSAQLASYIDADNEGAGGKKDKTTYHGPKYNIMNHNQKLSEEEMKELRELRELLRQHRTPSS